MNAPNGYHDRIQYLAFITLHGHDGHVVVFCVVLLFYFSDRISNFLCVLRVTAVGE